LNPGGTSRTLKILVGCLRLIAQSQAVLNQGDQGKNLRPPSLTLIPDIPGLISLKYKIVY
jgi:hypothetical protein